MANVKYISSRGVEFNLLSFDSAKLKDANFHKVNWIPDTIKKQYGTQVSRFTKDAQIFDCSFRFRGSRAYRKQLIDAFAFECEYDIAHMSMGKLWYDNQYIFCYMNKTSCYPSSDSDYTVLDGIFYCPYPNWTEEKLLMIRPSDDYTEGLPEDVKRYVPAYSYPYAYPYAKGSIAFNMDSAMDCNFKAILYGPTTLCQFFINGHNYTINKSLRANQKLILDTRDTVKADKRCYILNENGRIENVFDYRNPNSSIFKKIASGPSVISYTRTFGIDLYIYQERSAPI